MANYVVSAYDEVNTNRVGDSCNGLKDKPLGEYFQGVLVRSLDTVEQLLLVTVHGGILQSEETTRYTVNVPSSKRNATSCH